MGFNIKKSLGKIVSALPGSKSGIYDLTMLGASGSARKAEIRSEKAAKNNVNSLSQTQAALAEEARLRLIAQQSADALAEMERTRTTFAGSSIQSLLERKKLLGS